MDIDKIRSILLKHVLLSELYVSCHEQHYDIIAVDKIFSDMNKIERHQMIYAPITKYITNNEIHSVSIYAFSPKEWCLHKGKITS